MVPQEAMDSLVDAIRGVNSAGYVVTGELTFVKPTTHGLVEAYAETYIGKVNQIEAKVRKVLKNNPEIIKALNQSVKYVPRKDTGDVCSNCGSSDLRWAGACKCCQNCGNSLGCS